MVSRAHFHTFLVKDRKVQFGTHIDIHWDFAKADDTKTPAKGKHAVSGGGATDALPETIRERFHEQFPAYKDIK